MTTEDTFTMGGINYTAKRLNFMGIHIAEELNVHAVHFILDDGNTWVVEHRTIKRE